MELLQWIEQDMIEFLNKEYATLRSISEKPIPREEEVALFSISKDYEKIISEALKQHDFQEVKRTIHEIIKQYNESTNFLGEKEKMFLLLKNIFSILDKFFSDYGHVDLLESEYKTLELVSRQEVLPKKIDFIKLKTPLREGSDVTKHSVEETKKKEVKIETEEVDLKKVHEFITLSNKIKSMVKVRRFNAALDLYNSKFLPLYFSFGPLEKERTSSYYFEVSSLIEKIRELAKKEEEKKEAYENVKKKLWTSPKKKEVVEGEKDKQSVVEEKTPLKVVEKQNLKSFYTDEKAPETVEQKKDKEIIIKREEHPFFFFEDKKVAHEVKRKRMSKKVVVKLNKVAKSLYLEGLRAYINGDFDLAIEKFREVLEINPNFVPAKSRLIELLNRKLSTVIEK